VEIKNPQEAANAATWGLRIILQKK